MPESISGVNVFAALPPRGADVLCLIVISLSKKARRKKRSPRARGACRGGLTTGDMTSRSVQTNGGPDHLLFLPPHRRLVGPPRSCPTERSQPRSSLSSRTRQGQVAQAIGLASSGAYQISRFLSEGKNPHWENSPARATFQSVAAAPCRVNGTVAEPSILARS
jgi:hypothetical protein